MNDEKEQLKKIIRESGFSDETTRECLLILNDESNGLILSKILVRGLVLRELINDQDELISSLDLDEATVSKLEAAYEKLEEDLKEIEKEKDQLLNTIEN